jgi:hypothetical protein
VTADARLQGVGAAGTPAGRWTVKVEPSLQAAGDGDAAAEQLAQAAADGEAEAGAAEAAGGGVVDLGEGVEHGLELVGGDADAGVGDADGDLVAPGGRLVAGGEGDRAAEGELVGVAEDVEEDLLQAQGVGVDHRAGQLGVEVELVAGGAHGGAEGGREVAEEDAEVDGLGADLEASGLDAGEVEDVLDEV